MQCSQCVLSEIYPFIRFDENNVCHHCQNYTPPTYAGEENLLKVINDARIPGAMHDCLMGLSGGRDSSFALYYAVRKLGLKVLACTYDNGFIPKTTWENIQNAVQTLGVQHVVVKTDFLQKNVHYVMKGMLKRPSAAMAALLCIGCRTGYVQVLDKVAVENNCRFSLGGGGEPEESFAQMLLARSSEPTTLKLLQGLTGELVQNPAYLFNPAFIGYLAREFSTRFLSSSHHKRFVRMISLFHYIEWNEAHILETITTELKWRVPEKMSTSWRSDCKIHQIRQYLYRELLGFTKNDELLSQMIRSQQITRQQALERLQADNQLSLELLEEILGEIGFSLSELDSAISRARAVISK